MSLNPLEERIQRHLHDTAARQPLLPEQPVGDIVLAAKHRSRRRNGVVGGAAALLLVVGVAINLPSGGETTGDRVATDGDGRTTATTLPAITPSTTAPAVATPTSVVYTSPTTTEASTSVVPISPTTNPPQVPDSLFDNAPGPIVATPEGFVRFSGWNEEQIDITPTVETSPDGLVWTLVDTSNYPPALSVQNAWYHDGRYAVLGTTNSSEISFGSAVALSDDLVNWSEVPLDFDDQAPPGWIKTTRPTGGAFDAQGLVVAGQTSLRPDFEALGFDPDRICSFGSRGSGRIEVETCDGERSTIDVEVLGDFDQLPKSLLIHISTGRTTTIVENGPAFLVGYVSADEGGFTAIGFHIGSEVSNNQLWRSTDGIQWQLDPDALIGFASTDSFEASSQLGDSIVWTGRSEALPASWLSTDDGNTWERTLLDEFIDLQDGRVATDAVLSVSGEAGVVAVLGLHSQAASSATADTVAPSTLEPPPAQLPDVLLFSADGKQWTTLDAEIDGSIAFIAVGDDEVVVTTWGWPGKPSSTTRIPLDS